MNSDTAPRPADQALSGSYAPNEPGARTWREARALYVGGKHVTAEVSDRKITIFIGTLIAYAGPLPEFITDRGQVNTWVAEHVHALEATVNAPAPHRYGDACKHCGQPAYDYNVAVCADCRRTAERNGTDALSRLYTPGKAAVLAELRTADVATDDALDTSDTATPIVLDVQGSGREPVAYRVRFATEGQALAYMDAHAEHYYTEVEACQIPGTCERLLDRLYPLCSHGMSAELCYGPQHYASDEEIRQGW